MANFSTVGGAPPHQAIVKLEGKAVEALGSSHLFNEVHLSAPTQGTRNLGATPTRPPLRVKSTVKDTPGIEPKSPLVLSPTDTASTASTPGHGYDIWDLPETPQQCRIETGTSTPLTPPTANHMLKKPSRLLRTPLNDEVERVVERRIFGSDNKKYSEKGDKWINPFQHEDYFSKPLKLGRTLTKELQALTDANAAAAGANYELAPDLNFHFDRTIDASPSRLPYTPTAGRKNDTTDAKIFTNAQRMRPEKHTQATSTSGTPPKEVKLLEQIVPYAIHHRLTQNPHLCVASKVTSPGIRCSSRGPSGSIDVIIKDISKCNVATNPTVLLGHIERLARAVMCGTHRNSALSKKRQDQLRILVASFSKSRAEDYTDFQAWIDNITALSSSPIAKDLIKTATRVEHGVAPSRSRKAAGELSLQPATETTTAKATDAVLHIPKFLPYQPKSTRSLSVPDALREELFKPLKPTDKKEGFIYIFWDKEHFGKLKIGRTVNLERRLKEWDRDCGRQHSYHPAITRGELPTIPHYSRVERLMHIELKERRRQRHCEKCNRNHQEWFEVGDALVMRVFQKWRDWITQEPYALNTHTGEWVLRPEIAETLAEVCEPVHIDSTSRSPPRVRAVKTHKRKPKRRTI